MQSPLASVSDGKSGLDESFVNLVCMRASQINGYSYCFDMHSKDLRAAGETEQRLYGLDAWKESPYSDRERAALAWAEAVTNVQDGHVPDEGYRVPGPSTIELPGYATPSSDSRCTDAWTMPRTGQPERPPSSSVRPFATSSNCDRRRPPVSAWFGPMATSPTRRMAEVEPQHWRR